MCFMPGNEKKETRRAVLIIHPDFDQPGKAGILEAKNFADQLAESQRQLIKQAAATQPPDVVDSIRAHVGQVQVLVRNIPKELV